MNQNKMQTVPMAYSPHLTVLNSSFAPITRFTGLQLATFQFLDCTKFFFTGRTWHSLFTELEHIFLILYLSVIIHTSAHHHPFQELPSDYPTWNCSSLFLSHSLPSPLVYFYITLIALLNYWLIWVSIVYHLIRYQGPYLYSLCCFLST